MHSQSKASTSSKSERRTIIRDRFIRFTKKQRDLALQEIVDLIDRGTSGSLTFTVKTQFHKRGWVR